MAFLLLSLLIIFLFYSYFFSGRKILSPWFLLCLIFFVTYSIMMLNYNKWQVQVNSKFVIYISTAILSFGIGCLFVSITKKRHVQIKNIHGDFVENKIVNAKYPINLFLYLSIVLTVIYVLKLFIDAGTVGSFTDILRRIYVMQSIGGYSPGFIYNQFREIVVAIGYISVFRLFVRFYYKKDKISIIKLIIPILIFSFLILISTERNLFLRFAIYVVSIWIIVYSYRHKGQNVNLKIFITVAIMLTVIILLFFLMGVSKQYTSSFFDQISIYCASGLNNFNLFIKDFNEPLLYGKSTFTTFLGSLGVIFSPLGIEIGGGVDQIDTFISYITSNGYNYSSNIFSALKPYVEDFGYLGVIIFTCLIGALYQWLYLKAKYSHSCLIWIIYCLLLYPIIYFPILEQLFRRLHFGFAYELIWILIIYYFAFRKKIIVSSRCKSVKGKTI